MLEEQETYTLRELIENLPVSLRDFSIRHGLNEVTLARMRDGKPGMRSTINKILIALSAEYGQKFTLKNVTGITYRGEARSKQEDNAHAA